MSQFLEIILVGVVTLGAVCYLARRIYRCTQLSCRRLPGRTSKATPRLQRLTIGGKAAR